jgi:hypothetical protein
MSARGGRSGGGFTLVEILVSVTVLVGVLGGAYACLEMGFAVQESVEARIDAAQSARVALGMLAADLAAACPLGGEQDFVGLDRTLDGGMEADNLDFATHHHAPRAPGEGDLCEVSYFVDRNRETGAFGLWRRIDASPDGEPFAGGIKQEIATGLRRFRLEHYDGFIWHESWGERSQAARGGEGAVLGFSNLYGLPEAVRITIAFAGKDEPRPAPRRSAPEEGAAADDGELVFQTIVRLNLAARAFRSSSSSNAGASRGGS